MLIQYLYLLWLASGLPKQSFLVPSVRISADSVVPTSMHRSKIRMHSLGKKTTNILVSTKTISPVITGTSLFNMEPKLRSESSLAAKKKVIDENFIPISLDALPASEITPFTVFPALCTDSSFPFLSLGLPELGEKNSVNSPITWTNHSSNKITDSEGFTLKLNHTNLRDKYIRETELSKFMIENPTASLEEQAIFVESIDFAAITTHYNRVFFERKYEQPNRLINPHKPLIYGYANLSDAHFGVYTGKCINGTERLLLETRFLHAEFPTVGSHNSKYLLSHSSIDNRANMMPFLIAGVVDITLDMSNKDKEFATVGSNYINTLIRVKYENLEAFAARVILDSENLTLKAEYKKEEAKFNADLLKIETFVNQHVGIHQVLNTNAAGTFSHDAYNAESYDIMESASFNFIGNPSRREENLRVNKMLRERLEATQKLNKSIAQNALKSYPFNSQWSSIAATLSNLNPVQQQLLKLLVVGLIFKNFTLSGVPSV